MIKKVRPSIADEQQAAEVVSCGSQGPTAEHDHPSYLLETARPGSTMMRQGPEIAVARLNPELWFDLQAQFAKQDNQGCLLLVFFLHTGRLPSGLGGSSTSSSRFTRMDSP